MVIYVLVADPARMALVAVLMEFWVTIIIVVDVASHVAVVEHARTIGVIVPQEPWVIMIIVAHVATPVDLEGVSTDLAYAPNLAQLIGVTDNLMAQASTIMASPFRMLQSAVWRA